MRFAFFVTISTAAIAFTGCREEEQVPGTRGLQNLGSTCYMNSLLQVMMHTETVRDAVLTIDPESIPADAPHESLLRNLFSLFSREWTEKGPAIIPREVFTSLNQYKATVFTRGVQQDVDEAFSAFQAALTEAVDDVVPARANAFDFFRFELATSVRCDSGLVVGDPPRVEEQNRILLSFPAAEPAEGLTVRSMIESYFTPQGMDEVRSCNDEGGAVESTMLSLPRVLIITLHRNAFGPKIKMPVRVDHELTGNIFPGADPAAVYRLAGVVHHHGSSVKYGHYTASVHVGDSWYEANDSSFSKTREPSVSTTANFLVYELVH